MRRESVGWERAAEARDAAQGWLRVGAVDQATFDRILAAFPDPCVTPSAVWRLLMAGMVTAVVLCVFGAVALALEPNQSGFPMLLFAGAAGCLVATELLEGSPRHARRGAAGATGFWAVALLLPGLVLFMHDAVRLSYDDALEAALGAGVVAWAAACWRWGSPVFGGLSAVSLFLVLGRTAHGRLLWVLAGASLTALGASRMDRAAWAPSHRRAAAVVAVIGIAAAYAAANVYSLDAHLVEDIRRFSPLRAPRAPAFFALSAIATAVIPLAVLTWGLVSRRTLLLDAGIVGLALSIATLRHYVHVAPLWAALTASGAGLVALALVAERALRRAPHGEIRGFTADPLFSDEQRMQALQIVPIAATFGPAAAPAAEPPGFTGGGGKFGGGGATEKF